MKDRTPQSPGRVLITPEGGGAPFYATLQLADDPVDEGTPLNKANLLPDTTAALMGLGTAATPADMFLALANKTNGMIIASTTEIAAGSPLATGVLYVVYE